jgi:hypothetical protein
MNSKKVMLPFLALILLSGAAPLYSAEYIATMRGSTAINETSAIPENKSWAGCLSCHGPETSKAKGAISVSESHFMDRDGKRLENVSAARYFCTQCHVEQRDTKPLVINEFGADSKLH